MDKSEMKMLALAEKYYKPKTLAHAVRVAGYALADFNLYKYDVDKTLLFNVALAHDLLEDTDCPPEDIKDIVAGLGMNAVTLLTRVEGVTYKDYIEQIVSSENLYAIIVKRADMKDHLMRTDTLTDKLKEKYFPVLGLLI